MRRLAIPVIAIGAVTLLITGCMFRELSKQQRRMDALCLLSGIITADQEQRAPLVVVSLQQASNDTWRLVDHFISDGPGSWLMAMPPGDYALAAFEDRNGDFKYQPGERVLNVSDASRVQCAHGARVAGLALEIPPAGGRPFDREIDLSAIQGRSPDAQLAFSLSAVTAVGNITSLDDPRFNAQSVKAGMWQPYDFLLNAGAGVYFLQDYDPEKTPVLFVHGINGSPDNFRHLIEGLDAKNFQPWVYYYPSGVRLGAVADHLTQTMRQIEMRYRIKRVIVVAHSMGGLVSRGFLLRYQRHGQVKCPLFITLATPWGGHKAAQLGVDYAPTVVRSWFDMAPGSDYLRALFYDTAGHSQQLSAGTRHHLLFAFRRSSSSFGESSDGVVTVASELLDEAQREAISLRGFDDTHTGILENPAVAEYLRVLMSEGSSEP
jgi:pimeloyl-ACP methyl ester carboxylesterase